MVSKNQLKYSSNSRVFDVPHTRTYIVYIYDDIYVLYTDHIRATFYHKFNLIKCTRLDKIRKKNLRLIQSSDSKKQAQLVKLYAF